MSYITTYTNIDNNEVMIVTVDTDTSKDRQFVWYGLLAVTLSITKE